MNVRVRIGVCVSLLLFLPQLAEAQGMATKIRSLQEVLEDLYGDMLPLCSQLEFLYKRSKYRSG